MNSSYIGDPDNFVIRMMGAGGAPEFVGYVNRSVLTMRGGEFVEKLDYFTSPGYVDGGDSRYRAGMPEGSGPSLLITTKGLFRFDDDTKEMYLAGLHPNVTVDDIRSDVPWDLKIADSLETTPLPSPEELDIIRRFSPEISMGRKLQVETIGARIGRLFAKMAEKQTGDG
jgi:glutaconate CoA-transferase subunit B